MKKICVYTCITGDYDNVHEVKKKETGVDYLLFTNNKSVVSNSWQVVYIEDPNLDNQRLSRKIKMLGHPIIDKNYEISVWQDASVVFQKSVVTFVQTYLKNNSFAAFLHHVRDCIYDEAMACIKKKKDKKEIILKQLDFLRKEGFPEHYGLCEMTVFIKKHHDPLVKKTMEMWFDMVCRYSKRDQLSFMYCVFKNKLKIDFIPLNVWDNEWFSCYPHKYKQNLDTCRIYFGSDLTFDPNFDVQLSYQSKGDVYSFQTKVLTDTDCIEIELTDIPCMEFSDLNITGVEPVHIYPFNFVEWNGKQIFYSDSGMIKLEGNFKKDSILKLQVTLQKLSETEIYHLVEYLSIEKIKAADMEQENARLVIEKKALEEEIYQILHSRSWKITKPLRSFSSRKGTKNNK